MKNLLNKESNRLYFTLLSKIPIRMRVMIIFLFGIIFHAGATSMYSQEATVSLNMKNATIEEVLNVIEKKSDYYFMYNSKLVNVDRKVNISVNEQTIESVLQTLFASTNLMFRVEGKQILLFQREHLDNKSPGIQQDVPDKRRITGFVRDTGGEPLIGVTVTVKNNTSTGTITDSDGKYALTVPLNSVLAYTYIGYVVREEKIGNRSEINVTLQENDKLLDEVVVIGYGVQKKSDLTGAISSVNAKDLPQSATTSLEHMLAGKAAGLQITSNDAQPGGNVTISIRGKGTNLAGNDPLYVIDGFPVNGTADPNLDEKKQRYKAFDGARSPLNTINPNDIASIEVLKDASATAIYGARAANGVILITTKTGQQGKPKVNYEMKVGVQTMANEWKLMNASQWYQTRNKYDSERWMIDNKYLPYGNQTPQGQPALTYTEEEIARVGKGTDWVDQITRTGITNEHNISVSGATDITNYLASVNYYDQKGILDGNTFTRYAGRVNLSQKIHKIVTLGINATGSRVEFKNPTLGTGGSEASGLLEAARVFSPDLPVRDENGDFTYVPNSQLFPNPVSLLDIRNTTTQDRLLAQGSIDVRPFAGFTLRAQVGIDKQNATTRLYIPKTTKYGKDVNGEGAIYHLNKLDKLLTVTANYQKVFNEIHSINGLLGYEFEHSGVDNYDMKVKDFPSDFPGTNSMGDGKSTPEIASSKDVKQIASYFARMIYSLKSRYLFTFSIRADGSDRFGKNNRWGYFPSGAFAWRINEESFMKDLAWVSNLKLRLSAGQSGNDQISGSAYGYFKFSGERDYFFGGTRNAGAYQSAYANDDLKWETTTEYNLGLDMGFLNNRVNITLDMYTREISDLLANRTMMYYLPGRDVVANIGSSSSKGVELNLSTVNLDGEFKWTSNLNLSHYVDKWKKRNPDVALNIYESQHDRLRVHWGYELDGILQPGESLSYGNYIPGSQKVKDIARYGENGELIYEPDGIINDADKVKLKNQDPSMVVGFTNNFSYKNFDLSIHLYGYLGWWKYNSWLSSATDMNNKIEFGYNYAAINLGDYWSSENQNGKYPNIFNKGGEPGWSQYTLEKADFIRVKNITLGYTFSNIKGIAKWLNQGRVYVDVANPFVFTGFTQIDPEYSGSYPVSRSVTFGLNLEF